MKPLTIIDDPADWKRTDWVGREAEYTYWFIPQDLAELAAAVDALKARGVASEDDIIAVSSCHPLLNLIPAWYITLHQDATHCPLKEIQPSAAPVSA